MATSQCSITATLDAVGDRWTLLILRNLFRGVRRFEGLQKDLGIARNLLAARLQRLVDNGIVTRVLYQNRPPRYDYRLTNKGSDLSPTLFALMRWGDRWCTSGHPPTLLVHNGCDTPLEHTIHCPSCNADVSVNQIRSRPGPGKAVAEAPSRHG